MLKPEISVVIPAFNRANSITRAINSVLNQNFSNWELIVVDDCSSDETARIVRTVFGHDQRISLYSMPVNGGANKARNYGATKAQTRVISFFDSDDELHPLNLQNQIEAFYSNPLLGLSYVHATCYLYGQVVNKFEQQINENAELTLFKGLHGIGSSTSGMCVRKTVFNEVGGFDEQMPSHQDLDFFVRVAKYHPIDYIEGCNTKMHWDENNRISDNSKSVIEGAVYFFNKHEQRIKELGIYHHMARKIARRHAVFGRDLKKAYHCLAVAIRFKPLYFYAYIYAIKLPLLYLKGK